MKTHKYSYNICPDPNNKKFEEICRQIYSTLNTIIEEHRYLIDVDGSQLYRFSTKTGEIIVYNDYYIGALYVNSDVDLSEMFGSSIW